jgi:hypothetical protein
MADSPTNTYTGTITLWFNNRYPDSTAVALELNAVETPDRITDYAKALNELMGRG